jgi:Protein of unknown function (DUF2490)
MIKHFLPVIGIVLLNPANSNAQEKSTQLWTDFSLNAPLSKGYSFDNEFGYRTNIGNSSKWQSVNIIPKIEKSLTKHIDVMFYLGCIYTFQQENYNTWELRPSVGIRYHFNPFPKLITRVLARFEWRNQYTIESGESSKDLRSRFRLEEIYFLNGKSFADNKLWYALTDFEIFYTLDTELQERYSNQYYLRFGFGYSPNNRWRYECIYTFQFSKNTIEGEFSKEQEGILRLRARYYFK